MDDKLKTILSDLTKERESSYRKGSMPLSDILDSTAPLSNIIIERYIHFLVFPLIFCRISSFEEAQEVDSDKVVNVQKFKNGGDYKVYVFCIT